MLSHLVRAAGAARPFTTLESLEQRVMMDASYLYNGQESFLRLPSDRLGGVGANGNILILDDLNDDGVKEIAASGEVVIRDQYGYDRTHGVVRIFDGKDGSLIRQLRNTDSQFDSSFGNRVTLGGDQDSDGIRDLIVSDFDYYTNGGYGTIRVFSPKTGLQLTSFTTGTYYSSLATFESVGDLDADGESDLAISGVFPTEVGGNTVLLRAYSARTGTILWEAAPASGSNNYWEQRRLSAINPVGDVTGDGVPDMLIGGDDLERTSAVLGAVHLISGADGSVVRTWQVGLAGLGQTVVGNRVAYLGDVDEDGVGDFAVISYSRDAGSGSLVAKVSVYSLTNTNLTVPVWVKESIPWTRESGLSQIGFRSVGDFNHDGVQDLGIMVNPSARASTLRIMSGLNGATIHEFTDVELVSDRGRTTGNIFLGTAIASGDLDDDGFNELLIGVQQAESPREGKTTPSQFIAVVPLIQFEAPIVTGVNAAGVAFGTIAGKDFVTVNGLVTTVAGLPGALLTDKILDRNELGLAIGSVNTDGSDGFILVNGVRTRLATLATVDQLSTNAGFTAKPAGTYGLPTASKLASHAKAGLVKILRDGTIATTWLLRRNAADAAYELVYLFDGEPGAISADGLAFAVNGAGMDDSMFVTAQTGLVVTYPALFLAPGIDITAVTNRGFAGVRRTDSKTVVAYFAGTLDASDLTTAELPQSGGLDATPVSIDRRLDVLGSVAATGGTHAVLFTRNPDDTWAASDLAAQDWLHAPAFHDTTEMLTPLALSPFGRIYALHDSAAFTLGQRSIVGPYEIDPARSLANTPVGETGAAIVAFNDFGELVYFRRESDSEPWTGEELTVPAGAEVYGVVAWDHGVALATSEGVIRLTRAGDGSWDSRNLTATVAGATGIARSLRLLRQNNGYLLLAGINGDNEVVFFGSQSPAPDKDTEWGFDNLSESVLTEFEIADPNLQGDLVTYVTPWNGLNLAGINADGEPVVFWTAPGISGWRFTNLSASQEDPSLARGFERLSVNVLPWGGIALTDADSSLRTVWWSPGLGGLWKFAALADVVENSARPILVKESVVGFATTWGGQNIAGVDIHGHLWVFWWSPESDKWVAVSLENTIPALAERSFTTRLAAYVSGGAIPMGVTAVDSAHHAVHLYFKLGSGWLATDPATELEQV